MTTRIIIVCLLGLVSTVACIDEELTFNVNPKPIRNIRSLTSVTGKYELQSSVETHITSSIDNIISKLLNTTVGKLITDAFLDTPKFVFEINNFLGRDVLILNKNRLTISYINVTEIFKRQISYFLEHDFKLNGILLKFAEGFVPKIVTDFTRKLRPVLEQVNITVPSASKGLKGVSQNGISNLVLDLVVILLKPSQVKINQTLLNVTNELISLYKPVLPKDYFQSIFSCGINQTILKLIEVIEVIRESVNGLLLPPNRISKRSVDVSENEKNGKQTKIFGFIIEPIRNLLALILTPLHRAMKGLMNYILVTLRPIVGKIILSPIENIIMSIINLIPCVRC
ncbi:uncharacterized protein LOC123688945 isoform X2 [Harmonia axyridis]|uniref:uncharacterized protein LOC123688945 isoform X2 n=1 Tax=Harmonia axyridis TaxID=115357 RepID=UPI001E275687|nr:uncharacterized protein LOC123688945 isoform X2 [Harmonia axyridis]